MSMERERQLVGATDIPLQDADKPLTVVVTAPDRNAVQCSPTQCVIANALNRLPNVSRAHVGASMVYLNFKGIPMRYALSRNSAAMVYAYDNDNQIMPEGVTIELVPPKPSTGSGMRERGLRSSKQLAGDREHKPRQSRKPTHRNLFVEPKDLQISEYGL